VEEVPPLAKRVYRVPAVWRALDILEFLGNNGETSFKDICPHLNIPKSSVYQILETLQSRGYVRKVGDSQKLFLGFKLVGLGTQTVSKLDIRAEAMPFLNELNAKTKMTCHLSILDGTEGVYLIKVESSHLIRMNSYEGKRLPLHSTATGKALLAWLDEKRMDEIVKKLKLIRLTGRTITKVADLKRNLEAVRKRGWAFDDRENEAHIRGIAAPILNIRGEVIAAISLAGLVTQMNSDKLIGLSELVKTTAQKISGQLGNRSHSETKTNG
jgi:DNA-binding IclR family transcriptional regulator